MTEPMNGNNGMHDMTFKLPILLHGGDYVTPDEFAEAIFRYCAQVCETEEEPAPGELPPVLIAAVMAQDTVTIEKAIIAARCANLDWRRNNGTHIAGRNGSS